MEYSLKFNLYIISHSRPHTLHFSFWNIPLGCLCLVFSCLLFFFPPLKRERVFPQRGHGCLMLVIVFLQPEQRIFWPQTSRSSSQSRFPRDELTLAKTSKSPFAPPIDLGFSVRPAFRKKIVLIDKDYNLIYLKAISFSLLCIRWHSNLYSSCEPPPMIWPPSHISLPHKWMELSQAHLP